MNDENEWKEDMSEQQSADEFVKIVLNERMNSCLLAELNRINYDTY